MNALFDGTFDKVKLRHGIIKGVIVAACFIAFYMAGWLNPDIIAISIALAGSGSRGSGFETIGKPILVNLFVLALGGFFGFSKEYWRLR